MLSTYNTQPLTQALTSDLVVASPRIIFPPRSAAQLTHRERPSCRLDILDYTTCRLAAWEGLKCFPETKWRDTESCIDLYNIDFPFVGHWGLFFYGSKRRQQTVTGCFCNGILVPTKFVIYSLKQFLDNFNSNGTFNVMQKIKLRDI